MFEPLEANPPLIVDTDAVLTFPVPTQTLETIAGQGGQVSQGCGCIKTIEL